MIQYNITYWQVALECILDEARISVFLHLKATIFVKHNVLYVAMTGDLWKTGL